MSSSHSARLYYRSTLLAEEMGQGDFPRVHISEKRANPSGSINKSCESSEARGRQRARRDRGEKEREMERGKANAR